MLKKIIVLSVLLIFSNSLLYSNITGKWHVSKQGGVIRTLNGEDYVGFYTVIQNPTSKTLTCKGAGWSKCKINGCGIIGLDEHLYHMMDVADVKIYNDDVLSGSYDEIYFNEEDQTQYNTTISWDATIDANGEYNITQQLEFTTAP